jgi:hypothetical protein
MKDFDNISPDKRISLINEYQESLKCEGEGGLVRSYSNSNLKISRTHKRKSSTGNSQKRSKSGNTITIDITTIKEKEKERPISRRRSSMHSSMKN